MQSQSVPVGREEAPVEEAPKVEDTVEASEKEEAAVAETEAPAAE